MSICLSEDYQVCFCWVGILFPGFCFLYDLLVCVACDLARVHQSWGLDFWQSTWPLVDQEVTT